LGNDHNLDLVYFLCEFHTGFICQRRNVIHRRTV